MISRTPSPVSILKYLALIVFVLLGLKLPSPCFAASSPWQGDDTIGVRLITAVEATGTAPNLWAGLEVKLAKGWHTYWRSPGEAGVPPVIDWSASLNDESNLKAATLYYPAPHRYTAEGIETIGYRDQVTFPLSLEVRKAGSPLVLKTQIDLLLCNVLCVPKHFTLELSLPSGEGVPCLESALIENARLQIPSTEKKGPLNVKNIEKKADELNIILTSSVPFVAPDLFIENDKHALFLPPVVKMNTDKTEAVFSLKLAEKLPEGVTLANLPATLTAVDEDRALEFQIAPDVSKPAINGLGYILLLALLGGFLLNLMPCVLPVLSIKILAVLQSKEKHQSVRRRHFLATFAGILFSFLVLAFLALVLKNTGVLIGWGIQFQQPVFLIFLTLLVLLFAANLWGLYEITLPAFIAKRAEKLPYAGLVGDFFTGAFATLLATPCSAPFLGTAVGFALAENSTIILALFFTLGFGFGSPYLLMAFCPRLLNFLPKPGAWMVGLRKILAIALLLTAVWLGWIISTELSAPSLLSQPNKWQVFDESRIASEIAAGNTVFVDVTADWCLTCKVNKKFVLEREELNSLLFNNPHIVPMQADWTHPSDKILNYLQRQGRYGIPFYRVYGPKIPEGINLPELLTTTIVREAINKVSAQP